MAIFELLAIVLALSLSYMLAYTIKHWADKLTAYQKHVDRLFITFWNGKPEDEYSAWLKVRCELKEWEDCNTEKKLKYVDKNLKKVNKNDYLSGSYVGKDGKVIMNENYPIVRIDDELS